ncbi:hypothetical protein [Methylorubrum salsuginis]|uniref:hypothetical protein n=1 Tax=Methylorubrum salsuginis TaxID=414703 RepID=UPI0013F4C040|nr:hypothetical protein [Methylorubrum salsuginis]
MPGLDAARHRRPTSSTMTISVRCGLRRSTEELDEKISRPVNTLVQKHRRALPYLD